MTGHGIHSGDLVSGDEDVTVVDHLAVKLFMEMTLVSDKEEAAHHEAELWKAQNKAVSSILVHPHPPDLLSDFVPQMQQSAAIQDPLSVLTGVITNNNDVHSLDEEMAAIYVTPKVAKHQHLTNNYCGNSISKFTEKSSGFYSTFSSYVESKAKADNRSTLLQLLDKLEKGVSPSSSSRRRLHSFRSSFKFLK